MSSSRIKKFIIKLIPPLLLEKYRENRRKYGYFGIYNNWQEAQKHSSGYDSDKIIEKVKDSALKVKNGEAAYERDSITFKKVEPTWPLLASLLWIASQNNNSLTVLDFGGALGTSYYQNRNFLKHLKFSWGIIEQNKFVEYGKKLFEDEHLRFFYSTEEYGQKPDIVLLSSVLQYLEKPYQKLAEIIKLRPKYIVFDKTPFLNLGRDVITVQKVPSHIYEGSYPSWVFDYDNLLAFFKKHNYELKINFGHYSKDLFKINGVPAQWHGFMLESII